MKVSRLPGFSRYRFAPPAGARLYQRAIWYRRPRPLEPLKALAENPAELQAIRLRAIYLLTELGESSAKPWETKLDP